LISRPAPAATRSIMRAILAVVKAEPLSLTKTTQLSQVPWKRMASRLNIAAVGLNFGTGAMKPQIYSGMKMGRGRVLIISTIAVALASVGAWYALETGESAVKAATPLAMSTGHALRFQFAHP
jgi:hypothetical protein